MKNWNKIYLNKQSYFENKQFPKRLTELAAAYLCLYFLNKNFILFWWIHYGLEILHGILKENIKLKILSFLFGWFWILEGLFIDGKTTHLQCMELSHVCKLSLA